MRRLLPLRFVEQFNRIVDKLLLKLLDLYQIMRRIANKYFEAHGVTPFLSPERLILYLIG